MIATNFLGMHWLDALILVVYVVAILGVAKYVSRKVKTEKDFFLGGRSMGKWYQFFLNFGSMADPSGAPATAGSVYKQGMGGIWLFLIPLFLTPYYWFTSVWFRRVRLTTIADLFEERLGSRSLATMYAIVAIFVSVFAIGFGNIVALKTLQPIMVKSPEAYTDADRKNVADHKEYESLKSLQASTALSPEQAKRYHLLKDLKNAGKINPYVSFVNPLFFFLLTSSLVAIFIAMGGLTATAMIDAIQAVLIFIISLILIPFGLIQIGGFKGLHDRIPEAMFSIFGNENHGEFTWYSIAALLFMNFIGINASANMNVAGAAKDELSARIGAVSGGFGKRFMTIGWGMTGLIALALLGPGLSDSDQTWGRLTLMLLPVGLIGLMIVGVLGGKLASLGSQAVVNSALIVKNLYEPLFPGKSEQHYMVVARLSVPVLLGLGIVVSLGMGSAASAVKFLIAISVTWGAPIFLIIVWRRLTGKAVWVQVISTLLFIGVVPFVVSAVPDLRRHPALLEKNRERIVMVEAKATKEDVQLGKAPEIGVKSRKEQRIEPVALYFEEGLTRQNFSDPDSPQEGMGRFNVEIYLLARLGVDVASFTPPMLLTARFLVDTLFPIAILILVSYLTRPGDPEKLARFYVRLKTPVGKTPEEEAEAVALSYANPNRFDHTKLFPGSNWEFAKWDKTDALGFLACCAMTGVVLLVLKGVTLIGM